MTHWFGSDPHLGHKNILKYSNRPFLTIEEMEKAFFDELDLKYKKGDTIYLLGDICFYKYKEILPRLKPYNIHLIIGNHDHSKTRKEEYWASMSYIKNIKINDTYLVLCHFPIESWSRKERGSIHLHGHTHGNTSHQISSIENRFDVGYENTGQFLISFEEVVERLNTVTC